MSSAGEPRVDCVGYNIDATCSNCNTEQFGPIGRAIHHDHYCRGSGGICYVIINEG